MSREDVLHLPLVERHLFEDKADYDLTDDELQELARQILDRNEQQKKKVLRDQFERLVAVRRYNKLDRSPTGIYGMTQIDEWTEEALISHPTSFASDRASDIPIDYTSALERLFPIYRDELRGTLPFGPYNYLDSLEPAEKAIVVASALYDAVNMSVKTMSEMMALGDSFVCLCCERENRQLMSWKGLVSCPDSKTSCWS